MQLRPTRCDERNVDIDVLVPLSRGGSESVRVFGCL